MASRERYPLSWPLGWKRTPYGQRRHAAFSKRVSIGSTSPGGYSYSQKKRLDVGDGLARLTGDAAMAHLNRARDYAMTELEA